MTTASPPRALSADDLDRPIRTVLPELSRGAGILNRLGLDTPRKAPFSLPFRYDDFRQMRVHGELLAG